MSDTLLFIKSITKSPSYIKLIALSTFLYPNNRGFTIWNLTNMVVSQLYSCPLYLEKFNANNSLATMLSSSFLHYREQKLYLKWINEILGTYVIVEKLIHILPVYYYWKKNMYTYGDIKISICSMIYHLYWGYKSGNRYNMEKIYFKVNNSNNWFYSWFLAMVGHCMFYKKAFNSRLILHNK